MAVRPNIFNMLIVVSMFFVTTSTHASNTLVEYQTAVNKLSVHAESQPLRSVLIKIALRTGLEILFDPSIESDVTVKIANLPLEKALKRVVRKTNHVLYYKKDPKTKKQILVGLKVLPTGKYDETSLAPLITKKGDFFLMKKMREDLKKLSGDNLAYVRRMVRYNDLDAKQRAKVDQQIKNIEEQIEKNKVEREKRYAAARAASKPEPGEDPRSREEILKEENPIFYERMMERRREIESEIIGRTE